jgi:hypothetical protein
LVCAGSVLGQWWGSGGVEWAQELRERGCCFTPVSLQSCACRGAELQTARRARTPLLQVEELEDEMKEDKACAVQDSSCTAASVRRPAV